jgi:hypothetical protein
MQERRLARCTNPALYRVAGAHFSQLRLECDGRVVRLLVYLYRAFLRCSPDPGSGCDNDDSFKATERVARNPTSKVHLHSILQGGPAAADQTQRDFRILTAA